MAPAASFYLIQGYDFPENGFKDIEVHCYPKQQHQPTYTEPADRTSQIQ